MKQLYTLVLMQIRDKIDISLLSNKKGLLRLLLLGLIKFILVTAFVYLILFLCLKISLFYYSDLAGVMIVIIGFTLLLSLISCTYSLMKNLYFSDDNRVLITLPVKANKIFISKLIVFYIYELKKSISFIIPLIFASVLTMISKGACSFFVIIYMWVPIPFIILLPVLFGAILSIPTMYVYRFIKKYSFLEIILALAILTISIIYIVKLINMIPENIDLMHQGPTIILFIRNLLVRCEENLVLISNLIYSIIGEKQSSLIFVLKWITPLKLLLVIITNIILFVISYFASLPLFFNMMSKNFELNKNKEETKKNKRKNKYLTFINKEFVINLRTMSISLNYLLIYIALPVMILLLNKLYSAMDTKELGNNLIYGFNILLICLPLLASNGLVATYYSREGAASNMKKAKPIYAQYPLLAKLFFNMIFSIPSIFVTVFIFGTSKDIGVTNIIILGFAILFLHYAHMLYSAMLDIMNPQNEQYSTSFEALDNPNENKSTLYAFIISFVYAIVSFKLLSESSLYHNGSLLIGTYKLLFISLISFVLICILFMKRVKAFYYDLGR